ncbi:MetQ/NlpA family ABC transporter substrate-binding protein [Mycolicibacterium sp. 050158]|uniref:MetQ/NlpA family ABC transporter substrate-binding protein n=1 Tax=Mycolicibacterium sp. 050158 TaxID=3090602 RepID=UPI00299EBF27|nr:MetQ/NlpA family ABC transporter substrate-binding protein [Mycolicibacterium sp. 050158]MDX1891287.1 MetQ/NlpA family ABC transporter substrate-binding protein [Mycolicibacterium sp. 050158]
MPSRRTLRSLDGRGKAPLRVGATPVPHAEILDHVRDDLSARGIDLRIEIFEDFDAPNLLLAQGRLDANFFQYLPFLDEFNRRSQAQLVPLVPVHIEPFGLYARQIDSLEDIPDYAEIALPSDPVNVTRALALLDDLGLIECPVTGDAVVTTAAVRANPHGLVLKEVGSHELALVRDDFDVVFLFGNQAMGLGIDTGRALHCDRANPAYAEYLVAGPASCRDPAVGLLANALQSASTRAFIDSTYRGQLVTAF